MLWMLLACGPSGPRPWTVERVQLPLGSFSQLTAHSGGHELHMSCSAGDLLGSLVLWAPGRVDQSYRLDDEIVSAEIYGGGDTHQMKLSRAQLEGFRTAKRLRFFPRTGQVDFDMTTFGVAFDRLLAEGGCRLPTE